MATNKKRYKKPQPITRSQLNQAKKQAEQDAIGYAMAIFLTVIVDKFNGADWIGDVWTEINNLCESVEQGYVSVSDLQRTLREEYEIAT